MPEYIRISYIQLTLLLTGFLLGSSAIMNQSDTARQDSWLAAILAVIAGVAVISMNVWISLLNPGKSLIGILKDKFGNVFGTVTAVLYIWYFIHIAALVTRELAEFMVTTTYAETPIIFVAICMVLVTAYLVRHGLEVIARTSEILIPLLIVSVIIIFLVMINLHEYNIENLLPFNERGLKPILHSSFIMTTFPYGESILFTMIFPYLYHRKLLKASILGVLISGLLILGITLRDLMVLGPDLISRVIFPPHITTGLIPNLDITPLVEVNLIIAGGIKIAICIFAAALGIAQLLGEHDHKPFVVPISVLTVVLSIWIFDDILAFFYWINTVWPYYSIPFQFVIPVLLLLMSWLKTKQRTV